MTAALLVSEAVYRRMLQHARDLMPDEAGGFLGGNGCRVTELLPLPSVAGRDRFLAAPRAQFAAERRLARLGLALVAIYHSHPGGGPHPSALDNTVAAIWDVPLLLIGVNRPHGQSDEIRAYQLRPPTMEIPIHVV
ncbi:MAG TPA: M67 family metallopeptidase [Candidatus Limnocylindrales bacterium]|nr:M67 family metallopeptidase [Candidatus Limnocylindrales bacterium]